MTFRYQEFVSPGTWTWPGTVDTAQVTVVGGGGGATWAAPSIAPIPSGGGGGAVITRWMPVSAPVPITVGAGGTGGSSFPVSTPGGASYFGPAGPGPVPAIPTSTLAAGGGIKGGDSMPTPLYPIGGGGGTSLLNPPFNNRGGAYGTNSTFKNGGAGGRTAINIAIAGPSAGAAISIGEGYYGNGGAVIQAGLMHHGSPGTASPPVPASPQMPLYASPSPNNNTGAGGSSYAPGESGNGSSGIVIVRWFE